MKNSGKVVTVILGAAIIYIIWYKNKEQDKKPCECSKEQA
jgi:hypothetical protein